MARGAHQLSESHGRTQPSLTAIPTPPRSRITDAKTGTEILKQGGRKALCEDIRELTITWNLQHPKLAERHFFTDKVNVQFDVLGTSVVDGVARHVYTGDIVAVCNRGLGDIAVELAKKLSKPGALGHGIGDAAVFRLCARSGDDGLPLGGPRNKGVAEEDAEPGGGPTGVGAACPVRVRVGSQCRRGCPVKMKAEMHCALDVA